ncbi:MAG TPA: precorrin-2 C(20)-methyltransferase [Fibrobacteria bacterium]|nr:precorrin-2 C(20)-methyltransferase [Fibrobacteria bacterium]
MSGKGTLWGIGVGPGDPELVTMKGSRVLGSVRHVIAPVARIKSESLALSIAKPHLRPDATVHEREFPMIRSRQERTARWEEAASLALGILAKGEDVAFPTLGDPSLYSTWIYFARSVRDLDADVTISVIPGIPSFCAAAAATGEVLAEEEQILTIVPASADDTEAVRRALQAGPAVLMKVGDRAAALHDLLREMDRDARAVLATRVGLPGEEFRRGAEIAQVPSKGAYLSLILAGKDSA